MKTNLISILFILFFNSSFAYEFKNFKLLNSNSRIFGAKSVNIQHRNENIFAEIENTLSSDYKSIGEKLSNNSIANFNLGGGVKNYNGFTWNRPFLNFTMNIEREVSPHLYTNKFVKRDVLTLNIDAKTLLSNMKNEGTLKIAEDTLAAFAGIKFTRRYESATLVDSYQDGMRSDFSNLFFAFKNFKVQKVLSLNKSEFIKRVDTISASIGGVANIPVTTGLAINIGALGKYTFINLISAESKEDAVFINTQKESALKVGLEASLQLDFFNLINISLFSYELSYEIKKSKKIQLEIKGYEKENIIGSFELNRELALVLKGKSHDNIHSLKDYIKLYENRSTEDLSSKYELLLYGKNKTRSTQDYTIINNGETKQFYTHKDSSKSTVQTFFSKLFNNLLGTTGVKSELSKNLYLEYEKQFDNDDVQSSENFSFKIENSFFAKSLKRKRNRKRAVHFISYWSGFSEKITEAIKNKLVKTNLNITSTLRFNKKALDSFFNQTKEQVIKNVHNFCAKERKRRIRRRCRKRILKRYTKLYEYNQKYTTINMNLFRKFLSMIYNYTQKAEDFFHFFSKEEIHIYASINGKMANNQPFVSYYTSGQLKEDGVINAFSKM